MASKIIFLVFSFISFIEIYAKDSSSLTISRSRVHEDKTGHCTPLIVSFLSIDVETKQKPVDLICVVDVSGSMWGPPLELVKLSLEYLVNEAMRKIILPWSHFQMTPG